MFLKRGLVLLEDILIYGVNGRSVLCAFVSGLVRTQCPQVKPNYIEVLSPAFLIRRSRFMSWMME